ncbi:MAG: sugar transferase [Patescibacteria group bacterium]|nr:sugar transferase [Patescibacteria group bacterium]
MIWLAFGISYWLRLQDIASIPQAIYMLPLTNYLALTALFALVWVIIFALLGEYNPPMPRNFGKIFRQSVIDVSVALAVLIIVWFGLKEVFFSRLIAGYAWFLAIFLVSFGRYLVVRAKWLLSRYKIIRENIILLGDNETAKELQVWLLKQGSQAKIISEEELATKSVSEIIPKETDQVIVAGDLLHKNGIGLDLINYCEIHGIRFRYLPTMTELKSLHVASEVVRGYPVIELKPTPLEGWGKIAKRIFDFVASSILIILLSPLMIIIAILVRRDSAGPALFIQKRPGEYGREFNCFKYRSMYTHLSTGEGYGGEEADKLRKDLKETKNEGDGLLFKMKEDPRITKMGKWLRKTSFDELPQLFNVLNGDMSLVGPRPPLWDEVEKYNPRQFRRLMVKPGITGLWQVSGRSDASFEEYMKLDMYYIEHWSMLMDIQILFRTVGVVLSKKGAY